MAALILAACIALPAWAVDVNKFTRRDTFVDIEISPTGEFYAATVPLHDRTGLVVLRRADLQVTGTFTLGRNSHVSDFFWANDERLLITVAEKFGSHDEPMSTGEIFAMNADGSRKEILVGFRVQDSGAGSHLRKRREEQVFAELVDLLPKEPRHVLIAVSPFTVEPVSRVERLDIYTGKRSPVTRAPVRNAHFVADHAGTVRFASGHGPDHARKLYYRASDDAKWELVSDEGATGLIEFPVGFSTDDSLAYFIAERREGPDQMVAFDIASRERRVVFADQRADPGEVLYLPGTSNPIGALFHDGVGRVEFFDRQSTHARLQRSLEAAFEGQAVRVTSSTRDGRLALVLVTSDRNPGDFYLFDTVSKKADFVISRREWLDPDAMAPMRPIEFRSRDGLTIHGYLTSPDAPAGPKPLIVMPHGGPFGRQDVWGFDPHVQMVASAGYAVLQVNFRGSSGYGRRFREAGAREWGGRMQDDLTDATRWAIEQGLADPQRICIYGASYGGYAALMGVAKEPELYRCAVGYVGVYDLPLMVKDDAAHSRRIGNWAVEWVGRPDELGAVSPTRLADRIRAPVFLAAGGEDQVAPIEHSKKMEKALRAAEVPVETLYYPNEGHGFFEEEHQRTFNVRLLGFLARHLGGRPASAPSPAAK